MGAILKRLRRGKWTVEDKGLLLDSVRIGAYDCEGKTR